MQDSTLRYVADVCYSLAACQMQRIRCSISEQRINVSDADCSL